MWLDRLLTIGSPIASTASRPGRLGALSLLVQAGYALYKGRTKLAALLVGTAALATRWRGVAPIVNGALTLYRMLRRFR